MNLFLKITILFSQPQNTQAFLHLVKIILSPSTKISRGSLIPIPKVRRISIGMTILPSSSTFLTIPVAFNFFSLHFLTVNVINYMVVKNVSQVNWRKAMDLQN